MSVDDEQERAEAASYENESGLMRTVTIPLQEYDELDISVKDKQHAELIKSVMESAVSLEVPNKVDYESGPNWGIIK